MSNNQKFYILSTGRSGTTFLFTFFKNVYPELNLLHQLPWSRVINIIGNIPVSFKLRKKLILLAFKILKKEIVPKSSLDPLSSFSIYIYLQNNSYKNIKVVHLVRDPRDFVTSFMNWKNQSLSKTILHYLIPFWQPYPKENGVNYIKWIFMSKFEKYCWVWYYKNSLFKQLQNSCEYKLIRMEDLTKNTNMQDHLRDLVHFLELDDNVYDYQKFASHRVNKSTANKFTSFQHWTQKQKDTLQNICGDLMLEFGY